MTSTENGLMLEIQSNFYAAAKADLILVELRELEFKKLHLNLYGRVCTPKRLVYAMGDAGLNYSFSGISLPAEPWTPTMLEMKADVERTTGKSYNYALLNYYPDGQAGIAAHKDSESSIDASAGIACLSFGATRTLLFKKGSDVRSFELKHGSFYHMLPPTNAEWTHEIAAEPLVKECRVSVTFRHISKKRACDDMLPDDDWLTRYVKRGSPDNKSLCEWDLKFLTQASVVLTQYHQIRIHLREFTEHLFPRENGIMMLPATWRDFSRKLKEVVENHTDTSFIANNQLAVFVTFDGIILQQIFKENSKKFNIKPSSIRLDMTQLYYLKHFSEDISAAVWNGLFQESILPQLPSTCSAQRHFTEEKALEYFTETVCLELENVVKSFYKCEACSYETDEHVESQHKHGCINATLKQRYFSVGEDIFLALNLYNITRTLKDTCVCVYNEQFFMQLDMTEFKQKVVTKLSE